ncbi:MAG: 4Fe-4S cluster-binding domain-containing protein, partial [Phascolarctobacterium sp.]|nr:4Fe-4S cluster-binding domain-containing protein [Phascolarctobacterium sp.]
MRYLLQLHLTESCNLKCKHCYQSCKDYRLLSVEEVSTIMKQADELKRDKGFDELKVNLTGGEPLIIQNIKEYID